MNILSRFRLVKAFAFDMDGVLTDGSVLVNSENNWPRTMYVRDGYALQLAVKSGFAVTVISGSYSSYVHDRLQMLDVKDVFMNVKNKEELLKKYVSDKGLSLDETLFMGDDVPDYGCLQIAGLSACPADAAFEIIEKVSYISPFAGGKGCVRDVIEKVLKLNNKWSLQNDIVST
jgi:3-deoxy-D-manno-octulosonate 8-phosphate phosphatase (KDO 8-P phosphatase)